VAKLVSNGNQSDDLDIADIESVEKQVTIDQEGEM
jgi:hypothetical protein